MKIKKLAFCKNTVVNLDNRDLNNVNGGGVLYTRSNICSIATCITMCGQPACP